MTMVRCAISRKPDNVAILAAPHPKVKTYDSLRQTLLFKRQILGS